MADDMANPLMERLETFAKSDEERRAFITDLIKVNSNLEKELRTAKSDHLDQLVSRRMWQERAQNSESRLNESQGSAASNGFMLCLIDGDGYLFNDNLISQGANGGGEAATRLLDNIKRHIQHFEGAMQWKIMVRIYANLEGLLKKYTYINFVEEKKALLQFVVGFTQIQPLFDFIDAGQGKERADHKIKEQLSLFINNSYCKHIMLGVAHDNGYVPALDPYKNNPAAVSRIALIEPLHLGWEFSKLPFEVTRFESLFRSQELPNDRVPPKGQPRPYSSSPFNQPSQPQAPQSHRPVVGQDLITRRPIYPGPLLLNKDDERVDEYLGTPSDRGEANLESRIRSGTKLCNMFHLRGHCIDTGCPYSHEPSLEGEELVAFALKARLTACHAGSSCRSKSCVSGHLCPHGSNCWRKKCYFSKVHHVDPKVHHIDPKVDHEVMDTR
ncbi:MAG: hypothetical protein Q9223_007757 [Gallowayella weberi]